MIPFRSYTAMNKGI